MHFLLSQRSYLRGDYSFLPFAVALCKKGTMSGDGRQEIKYNATKKSRTRRRSLGATVTANSSKLPTKLRSSRVNSIQYTCNEKGRRPRRGCATEAVLLQEVKKEGLLKLTPSPVVSAGKEINNIISFAREFFFSSRKDVTRRRDTRLRRYLHNQTYAHFEIEQRT